MLQALASSGLTAADISSVEVVGGSMRVPALGRLVEEVSVCVAGGRV
jgi:molecular chaperone DnaK (HSP70)